MIEMNNELISAMRKFRDTFGDVVPLREIPQTATNDDIIKAINDSLETGTNVLPEVFGYKEKQNDDHEVF